MTQPIPESARRIWGDDTMWCADCQAWHHRLHHVPCEPNCSHGGAQDGGQADG